MPLFDQLDPRDYELPEALRRELLSPALVVYLNKVRANVRRMVEACGSAARWQPHVKTTKIPRVWDELVAAGVRSFKCATTREALLLAKTLEAAGVDVAEVLCAYPLVGPNLARLGQIANDAPHVRFAVLCEDAAAVASIPDALEVFVDVNPGMNRTGIPLTRRESIFDVARAAGERFAGVHWYDGHHHAPDAERAVAIHADYALAEALLAELDARDCHARVLITSGTPAFLHALAYAPFASLVGTTHRVSPGTVVFHDARSEELNPDFTLEPAALVLARVASRPTDTRVTVDAGSKAISADVDDPCAHVLGRPDLVASTPNEEHLPLDIAPGGVRPERGDVLFLIATHICPTVNLADDVVLIDNGELVGIVDVEARGHELRRA